MVLLASLATYTQLHLSMMDVDGLRSGRSEVGQSCALDLFGHGERPAGAALPASVSVALDSVANSCSVSGFRFPVPVPLGV